MATRFKWPSNKSKNHSEKAVILIANWCYKSQEEFEKPFAESFSTLKNKLSRQSALGKIKIPQKSWSGSHLSLKTTLFNG